MFPVWLLGPAAKFATKGGLKLFAGIGLAIAVALLAWRIHHHGYVAGTDHVQAQWDRKIAAEQAAFIQQLQAVREAEALATDENRRLSDELSITEERNRAALAVAAADAARVQRSLAIARERIAALTSAGPALDDAAAKRVIAECAQEVERIRSEDRDLATELGGRADEYAGMINGLQDYARLAQSVCGG